MSAKRRPKRVGSSLRKRIGWQKRIATLQTQINRLTQEQTAVGRDEFGEVVSSVRQLQRNTDDITRHTAALATQLTRMGQIQAEVDEIRRALQRAKLLD